MMGHWNSFSAFRRGEFEQKLSKNSMPGGGGGSKRRFDWYIIQSRYS